MPRLRGSGACDHKVVQVRILSSAFREARATQIVKAIQSRWSSLVKNLFAGEYVRTERRKQVISRLSSRGWIGRALLIA